jgi:Icc protein
MNSKTRILQITDCHLLINPDDSYRDYFPEQRLDAVISKIADSLPQMGKFDYLLLTGDIAQQAQTAVYQRILNKTKHLANEIHWIAGNHDDIAVMSEFAEQQEKVVHINEWALVLLDSTSNPNGVGSGSLADEELALIEKANELQAAHIMLVLHHPPVDVASRWQDEIKLGNALEFWEKVSQNKKVKAVTFGHLHQEHHFFEKGVELFCSPATAPQFKKRQEKFMLEDDPLLMRPGYRTFELSSDGSIASHVLRVG